jgi:hypothetical protein
VGAQFSIPVAFSLRQPSGDHGKVNELDQEFWRHDAIDICIPGTLKS